jgi:hypothetical protein
MTNPAEGANPAAANQDPFAGLEIPPVLDGIADRLLIRAAGGSIDQRDLDLMAYAVEMTDARRARSGQAVGAAATAAEATATAAPVPEKAEAKRPDINTVMGTFPSTFSYDWGGTAAGEFSAGSAAGTRLYNELNNENTELPEIGVPGDIADRESVIPGKTKLPRELVGFTVIPQEHAAELRPLMDLPAGTNPNLQLVTFEYGVMGDIPSQSGSGKPEVDAVNLQVTVPYDVALRLSAVVHKNPRAAREFVAQALNDDVERAKGTEFEQGALQMRQALLSRFKMLTDGIDRRPGAHMMLLTDMDGQGTPQEDGYVRHQLPLAAQQGSAPAPAQGHPGGAIGAAASAVLGLRRKRD